MSAPAKTQEKMRPAYKIDEGWEVKCSDGEWYAVVSALHITSPLKVSSFTLSDGEVCSVRRNAEVMSRWPVEAEAVNQS